MKKIKTVSCSMYYSRAAWDGQSKAPTLQDLLTTAHKAFANTEERDCPFYDRQMQGIDFGDWGSDGLGLHISTYSPGQSQSTIPVPGKVSKGAVATHNPPQNRNFLRSDLFMLLDGNHVLLLPNGAREGAALHFMRFMLRKMNEKQVANSLELKKIARIDKYKQIESVGVRAIKLNSALYDATVGYESGKNIKSDFVKSLADVIKTRFGRERTFKEITENENLHVDIQVRFDGREANRRENKAVDGFGVNGKQHLRQLAISAIQEAEEGFEIILNDGTSLTSEEVRVRASVKLPEKGNSVTAEHAWEALTQYRNRLKAKGILAQ